MSVNILHVDLEVSLLLQCVGESSEIKEGLLAWGHAIATDHHSGIAEQMLIVRAEFLLIWVWTRRVLVNE
jgi:hypothetical protein